MTDRKFNKRIRLALDQTTRQQLTALAEHHGSQIAAVREAIAAAHAQLVGREKRAAFIKWLDSVHGEPSEAEHEWASRVAAEVAAAEASLRSA